MTFADLAVAQGVMTDTPTSDASLARALLANIKLAYEQEVLTHSRLTTFFQGLIEDIEKAIISAERPLEAFNTEALYGFIAEALYAADDCLFVRPAPSDKSLAAEQLVSVQPLCALGFWLSTVGTPESLMSELEPEAVKRVIDDWDTPASRVPGETVGRRGKPLWLTILHAEVAKRIEDANRLSASSYRACAAADHATWLREALGLWDQLPRTHLFAVVTTARLENLNTSGSQRPVPPSVFDAKSYVRFRHWPKTSEPEPNAYGRTYDLNRERRRAVPDGRHGVEEMVSKPLQFAQVERPIYLGEIWEEDDDADLDDLHREFADDVAGNQSLADLLLWVDRTFK